MVKVGGYGVHDISTKDRCAVYEYYMGRQDSLTFGNGVTINYREDGNYSFYDHSESDKKDQ